MRTLYSPAILSALMLVSSFHAADEKKENEKDAKVEQKLVPLGNVVGVVQSLNPTDGLMTVEITLHYLEPNPQAQANYARQYQQLLAKQVEVMRTPNLVQRRQKLVELMQAAQNLQRQGGDLIRVKEVKTKVDLKLDDDVKVRTPAPPTAFDDKGNVKQYTQEELKELRKDKLPGFPADKEDLRQGQTIYVTVARLKSPAKKDEPKESGGKEMPANEKPLATLIVIVADKK
jgi:hypothetical protein